MNKFGIFSLLNSFLQFYKNNNLAKVEEKPEEKQEKKQLSNDFASALNNIFGAKNENKTENKKENKKENTPVPTIPLQKGMLNVMNNHEKIVKRILESNNNK